MDAEQFWTVIERVDRQADGDMPEKCEALQRALTALSPAEVAEFKSMFDAMMDRAFNWQLWGAAYVIHGGCGDDTFSDFCASLISRGRMAFETALRDPDSLAAQECDEEQWFYEGFQYAVVEAAKQVCGKRPPRATPHPNRPSGTPWKEDTVYNLYPRLAAKYG